MTKLFFWRNEENETGYIIVVTFEGLFRKRKENCSVDFKVDLLAIRSCKDWLDRKIPAGTRFVERGYFDQYGKLTLILGLFSDRSSAERVTQDLNYKVYNGAVVRAHIKAAIQA